VVVFLYSGHGLLDLSSYDAYLAGRLTNYEYPEKDIAEALKACPDIPE
jgi:tryptophan synthase beta chain